MTLRLGRYETIERLAAGGMATVYLGRAGGEGGFERMVAIKVMHDHVAEEPEFRSMFLDEARLAARIRHPNVVGVIDIQKTTDDVLFIVMDYVDGPSLFQLRKKLAELGKRLPLDVTLRIFVDTLGGLHAAHDLTGPDGAPLQLVHRDVSPQNILLGMDGITRITDFGVARAEERITSTRGGQLKGKLPYMPPEQVRNEDLDRRGDVYATGVALWEALTGKRLFDAMSDGAMVHQIAGGAKQSPHDVNSDIPKPISDVCMRALSLKKEDRYPSAADFSDALEHAARDAGTSVATTRGVASFLAGLPKNVSGRPGPMPGSSPSKVRPAGDALSSSPIRDVLSSSSPIREPFSSSPPTRLYGSAADRATVPEPAVQSALRGESTKTGFISEGESVQIPKRSRRPLLIGVAVVLLAGVAAGAWRFGLFRAPEPSVPASVAAISATPTPAAPPAAPTPAESAIPAPPPSAAASAIGTTSAAPPAESHPAPSASAPAPYKPPVPNQWKPPTGRVGPGYNPGTL